MRKGNKQINLSDLDKRVTYKVPNGYFDRLPYSIQERIQSKRSIWSRVDEFSIFFKISFTSLLLLLLAFFFWNRPTDETQSFNDLLAEVTDEEIVEYLYLEDFSTYEIVSTIELKDSISMDLNTTQNWLNDLPIDELENILNIYNYDTSIQYY